jgi:hypothetical protein
MAIAIAEDGQSAVTGGYDKTIRVWDLATGQIRHVFEGHTGAVEGLTFAGTTGLLVSVSDDGTIKFWDLQKGLDLQTLQGHTAFVRAICSSTDGYLLVSGGGDKTLRFWDFSRPATYEHLLSRVRIAQEDCKSQPNDPSVMASFGEWYLFRGLFEWAVRDLISARTAGAKISSLDTARCFWQLGKLREASREFEAALQGTSDPSETFYLRFCIDATRQPTLNPN